VVRSNVASLPSKAGQSASISRRLWSPGIPVHTSAAARRCSSSGFVERLQGSILHEHWRIEFRRQYFTSRHAMQRSLDGFMKFYNERRPHQGYRLRGRTPADLFTGAAN
jgi:transposase InsO family protein